MSTHQLLDLMHDPLDGTFVATVFKAMGVCEDVIADFKERHPTRAVAIDKVFGKACPPEGMLTLAPKLYQAHVEELCQAAVDGREVPCTNAHAAMVLSQASLSTNLRREHLAASASNWPRSWEVIIRQWPERKGRLRVRLDAILGSIRSL